MWMLFASLVLASTVGAFEEELPYNSPPSVASGFASCPAVEQPWLACKTGCRYDVANMTVDCASRCLWPGVEDLPWATLGYSRRLCINKCWPKDDQHAIIFDDGSALLADGSFKPAGSYAAMLPLHYPACACKESVQLRAPRAAGPADGSCTYPGFED